MSILPRAEQMLEVMLEQFERLLQNSVTLGVPMESRVKEWSSIRDKIQRKALTVPTIEFVTDLIGLRIILLFREDIAVVDKVIRDNFQILSVEDKASLLGEAQFGYQSLHYQVKLPAAWYSVPTMADLKDLQAEIQLRTVAQHIWAAAAHKLQYKHETSVPPPIRRSLNRAAALLETIDLEFDRVLTQRRDYQVLVGSKTREDSEQLNVDLLKALLAETFPAANQEKDENVEELLRDLSKLSISTVGEYKKLLKKHRSTALADERLALEEYGATEEPERFKQGIFFNHVGLGRNVLRAEFGTDRVNLLFEEH